jgi:hypothetical protein
LKLLAFWEEEFSGCLEDAIANPIEAYAGGVSCEADGPSFGNGEPYEAVVTACADADGELILLDTTINCTYSAENVTIKFGFAMTDIPSCILSQEVEPACDPDLYGRYIEDTFESAVEFNCTAKASVSVSGEAPTAPTADGGGGGDAPAPAPTTEGGGGDDEPAPTPAVPTSAGGGAAATTSACAGVFGSLVFGSTLMAATVLTILVI